MSLQFWKCLEKSLLQIFLKQWYFEIKVYKILLRDSIYIVNVVMWPKFGNSNTFIRKFIITSILWRFEKKNYFFVRFSWFKFNNLGLAIGIALTFYTSVAKGLSLKVRKFWGLNPTFVEGEKLVGEGGCGAFWLPPNKPPSWRFELN